MWSKRRSSTSAVSCHGVAAGVRHSWEPRRSYNEMLADSAWLADWEGALETLQDMRSLGVTPDVTSDLVRKKARCLDESLR